MHIPIEKLKELLVRPGHISEEQLSSAAKEAKEKKVSVESIVIEKGLISDENLGRTIAEGFGFKFVNLERERIDEAVLQIIPELVARSRGVISFFEDEKILKIGMTNPGDLEIINSIKKKKIGKEVLVYYITSNDLRVALDLYKKSLKKEFDEILANLKDPTIERSQSDELTVKMVDMLLAYANQNKASDIHVEPYREVLVIRFRIDGVMHKVLELPKDLHDLIVSRIKIMAKLRTDEHRAAQDGKLRFESEEELVDVRVSVVPIVEGENVVMRLLSAKSREFDLESLGFSGENLKTLNEVIKSPNGMILVTGPTGSGKTTTLYAVLKILNKPEVHISTIEDPVEYDIEGVSQIQVNPKTNLTFAKGLRAIVRQDPDIIMVGEIRDAETAGIAVNSALTGHLVLSTLHTNDAPTALPRLIDMDVEPFLVASTVNVIIAQRLVRKICMKCRASQELTQKELESVPEDLRGKLMKNGGKIIRVYRGAGCKVCGNTGYKGRTGIFELLVMSDQIKDLIVNRASSGEIMKKSRELGMKTMFEDGLQKVLGGETTLEEIVRVSKE